MHRNNRFSQFAIFPGNAKYLKATQRIKPIYQRETDIRDDFERDYTRILFSKAYRRLKHKTQVFFAVSNDHICTRMEHVTLVQSVSESIAECLGLNCHLTRAIAAGHDLGHAPFGHGGEKILSQLHQQLGLGTFFHERNSLYFADQIETLIDDQHHEQPLNLTYAVRDGIISHCGESHLHVIYPRDEAIDLESYQTPGQFAPYTFEGCVVKMADKIAYLSRDIEDAMELGLIDRLQLSQLEKNLQEIDSAVTGVDNGTLIHYFIQDICQTSQPELGIALSNPAFQVMQQVMDFNYQAIYLNERLKVYDQYVALMIHSLFDILNQVDLSSDLDRQFGILKQQYPTLAGYFYSWLQHYGDISLKQPSNTLYCLHDRKDYQRAILDYIAGMTDTFILKAFNEVVSF